jgi:hypothetical protein
MKTINNWQQLSEFGIVILTGEACGLSYRFLCDLTEQGKKIVEKCLGQKFTGCVEQWNSGPKTNPHVTSIMLPPEMFGPLAVFCLLESGCIEAWNIRGEGVIGIEVTDNRDQCVEFITKWHGTEKVRRFAYQGTAGHRNVHQMSGRVE